MKVLKRRVVAMSVVAGLLGATAARAEDALITVPSIGIDVNSILNVGAMAIGAVLTGYIGFKIAFLIARRAVRWLGRLG